MEGKVCCFIGHRKIEKSVELTQRVSAVIQDLIENKGVQTFLFGSRSEFDDLCHSIVTELKKNNPPIKRIMYTCRSEYACMKEEKEERERIAREVTKRDIKYKDYDGAMMSDRLWLAGKASYVERNQDMINESDYCVFYYNPEYQPPKRKYSKRDLCEYKPKSGTKVAFDYVVIWMIVGVNYSFLRLLFTVRKYFTGKNFFKNIDMLNFLRYNKLILNRIHIFRKEGLYKLT